MRRYRGYCKDLKKWIYGDLIHFSNGNGLAIRDERGVINEVLIKSTGQDTGLTDKNKKPIYGGDILKTNDNKLFKAKYSIQDGGYMLVTLHRDKKVCFLAVAVRNKDVEVVGNIFDIKNSNLTFDDIRSHIPNEMFVEENILEIRAVGLWDSVIGKHFISILK